MKTTTSQSLRQAVASGVLASAVALSPSVFAADAATYLVQGSSVASLKAAVASVGGDVTHELNLIKAVRVELTESQKEALATRDGKRLMLDEALKVSSGADQDTVRDEFLTVSYDGNDGTATWNGGWIELGANGDPTLGPVTISSGNGNKFVRFKNKNKGVQRAVAMPAGVDASITFNYNLKGLDAPGRFIELAMSSDGGATS